MKLISWDSDRHGQRHLVFLFGSGLIGGAIGQALSRQVAQITAQYLPFDWTDAAARRAHSQAILEVATQMAKAGPPLPLTVDVVWAAGRSGFGSNKADMERETALLSEILALAQQVGSKLRATSLSLHLFSSAGGLFEGQRFVGAKAEAAPMRPYGTGKARQEEILRTTDGFTQRFIYRPSSVYGYSAAARMGLIGTLIANGLLGRTSTIFGRPQTVRDYVFADDIGRFIAQQITAPAGASAKQDKATTTFLLASGRPSTMFEIIERVEAVLGGTLLLQYDTSPYNALDMSYRPSGLDPHWNSTALDTGIRVTEQRLRSALL